MVGQAWLWKMPRCPAAPLPRCPTAPLPHCTTAPLHHCVQEGDLDKLVRGREGALLSEGEVMLKFVQLCLALQHVHGKVRPVRGRGRGLEGVQCGGRGARHAQTT